jgi:hypothetical protein
LETNTETPGAAPAVARRGVPRVLRTHAWPAAAVLCVLVGAGFRYAATSEVPGAGGSAPASTACTAK